jgi:hypothetical protein
MDRKEERKLKSRAGRLRRGLINVGAIGLLSLFLPDCRAMAQTSDRTMTFSDLAPNIVVSVLVPAGWDAGKLTDGVQRIAHNPTVMLYGGIGDQGKRVSGEFRMMELNSSIDIVDAFVALTAVRHNARLVYSSLSAGTPRRGVYTLQYVDRQNRALFERIDVLSDRAFSIIIGSNGDAALDQNIRRIMINFEVRTN